MDAYQKVDVKGDLVMYEEVFTTLYSLKVGSFLT